MIARKDWVLGIAVVQQIAAIPQRAASLHGHISRDLPEETKKAPGLLPGL
jgi:hypothetical protein